jgi:hypothetical protein
MSTWDDELTRDRGAERVDECDLESEEEAAYRAGIAEGRRAERADVVAYIRHPEKFWPWSLADHIENERHINAAKTDEVKNG